MSASARAEDAATPDGGGAAVVTTVFPPSAAVARIAADASWRLWVVGDRKTPADWRQEGASFLDVAWQERCGLHVARALPWNHYCRKMLGYLAAVRDGARSVYDVDDDTSPLRAIGHPPWRGTFATHEARGFANAYSHFTDQGVWPRGLPLRSILDPRSRVRGGPRRESRVAVWQGLVAGDPDVDAIWRLTRPEPVVFEEREPVVLGEGATCPFNSQNTHFHRDAFALLYLPATVTFRFCDILRSLVAQPVLWKHGLRVGFTSATAVQERNPHDGLKDFESEVPCYLSAHRVPEVVSAALVASDPMAADLVRAYRALRDERIVGEAEVATVEAWVEDLASASDGAA